MRVEDRCVSVGMRVEDRCVSVGMRVEDWKCIQGFCKGRRRKETARKI
jgi:hypothetical protein